MLVRSEDFRNVTLQKCLVGSDTNADWPERCILGTILGSDTSADWPERRILGRFLVAD